MSEDLNKFNTILLDNLIDALTIIKNFVYVPTTGVVTVSPTSLANLDIKINRLKKLRDLYKSSYEDFLKEYPKIIDELNKLS
mgnify:FL=1